MRRHQRTSTRIRNLCVACMCACVGQPFRQLPSAGARQCAHLFLLFRPFNYCAHSTARWRIIDFGRKNVCERLDGMLPMCWALCTVHGWHRWLMVCIVYSVRERLAAVRNMGRDDVAQQSNQGTRRRRCGMWAIFYDSLHQLRSGVCCARVSFCETDLLCRFAGKYLIIINFGLFKYM